MSAQRMSMPPTPVQDPAAHNIIHHSHSPIAVVLHSCQRIAQSEATVLLNGETGTGKEVFARYIHSSSPRNKTGPFVPVNCGAIPENLMESEFFGFVKGAFTGAGATRMGRIAAAECGTLFLDEIGGAAAIYAGEALTCSSRTYPRARRQQYLRNRQLFVLSRPPIGDLALEVQAGRFRQDLYYRLFVRPIALSSPPVTRPVDIGELSQGIFGRKREKRERLLKKPCRHFTSCSWPG